MTRLDMMLVPQRTDKVTLSICAGDHMFLAPLNYAGSNSLVQAKRTGEATQSVNHLLVSMECAMQQKRTLRNVKNK